MATATEPVTTDRQPQTALAPPAPKSALATASFGAPRTYEEAWDLAKKIAGSDLAPKDFKGKPENCLIAMQMGAEIGLSPMASIQNIAVINGRPTIWGDSMLALIMNHPQYESHEEFLENEDVTEKTVGVFRITRKGHKVHEIRFSVADAKTAKLWGKEGPWTNYPKRMLKLRARGWALRDKFPDALRGIITAEEAMDYPGVTIEGGPIIADAERDLYQHCDKLLEQSGMNQAQREAKLSQHKGQLKQLLSRLETNLAKANGEGHVEAPGADLGRGSVAVSDAGVSPVEARGAETAEEPTDEPASVQTAAAEIAPEPERAAAPTPVAKPKKQSGFAF